VVLHHGLVGLYLGAALQRGQRRDQGFLLLHIEVVLLRVGDGLEPRHHELNELVPGAALQLGQRLNQGFLNWAVYSNTGLVNSSYSALVTVSSNLLLVTFHSNTSSTRVLSVGWWNFSTSSFFYLISSSECIAKCAMTLRDLAMARYWFIEELEIVEDSPEDGEASTDATDNKHKHKCSERKQVTIEQSL